jgi:hypothetical protein
MVNAKVAVIVKLRGLIHNTETLLGQPRIWAQSPLAYNARRLLIAQLHYGEQTLACAEEGGDYSALYSELDITVRAGVAALGMLRAALGQKSNIEGECNGK